MGKATLSRRALDSVLPTMYVYPFLIDQLQNMPLKSVRMCRLTRCQVDKYGSWLHCLDGALKAAMAFRSMKMIIPFMY